jgi:Protein of unknown function (DUF2442)
MIKIVRACWIKDQQIALVFSDGSEGEYDFAPLLAANTPLTQPLQDTANFQRFFLELGALCWPHGLEFSADKLHTHLQGANLLHLAVAPG